MFLCIGSGSIIACFLGCCFSLFCCCTTKKLCLLLAGLKAPMTELRRRVNELQCNLLRSFAADLWQQGLAKGYDALLRPHHGALDHDPILGDFAKMCKSTHGSDALL